MNSLTTNQKSLTETSKKQTFSAFIATDAIRNKINEIVGGKDGQQFITAIISAVSANPTLAECSHTSILAAAFTGQSLKLSPSPQLGHYYMLPFNNNKTGIKEAQFVLGAKGYKQLAMRSGQYLDIDVLEIREGEYKGRDKYTGKQIFEFVADDVERESLSIIGYLAYFELLNGFKKSIYWTKAKMEKHADKYSPAFSLKVFGDIKAGKIKEADMWKYSSFWYKDFDGMAAKTMIRNLLSQWGIMSIEMQKAFEADTAAADTPNEFVGGAEPEPFENSSAEPITVEPEATEQIAVDNNSNVKDNFFD